MTTNADHNDAWDKYVAETDTESPRFWIDDDVDENGYLYYRVVEEHMGGWRFKFDNLADAQKKLLELVETGEYRP